MTLFKSVIVNRIKSQDKFLGNMMSNNLRKVAKHFMAQSVAPQYSYNFSWMGRPIIQYPQDIIAVQELIWNIKPDLIIETGIAHGGSAVFFASLLELNALSGGPKDAKYGALK